MWRTFLWSEYHRAVLIAYEHQTAFGRGVVFLQIDSESQPSYIASEIAIVRGDRDDFFSGIEIEHTASFPVAGTLHGLRIRFKRIQHGVLEFGVPGIIGVEVGEDHVADANALFEDAVVKRLIEGGIALR